MGARDGTHPDQGKPKHKARPPVVVWALATLVLALVGCGGGSSPSSDASLAPASSTAADQQAGTSSSEEPQAETTAPSAGEGAGGEGGGASDSSAIADPSSLLTDEEAAEFFGKPAKHEGPEAVGAFTNVTYSPADGSLGMIIITTYDIGSRDTFETFLQSQAEALNEEGKKVDGIGESAYYFTSMLQFYRNGGMYQVTTTEPPGGQDMMAAMIALAKKMDPRIP
ncbi:MAG: hypothetical protein M5U22_08425 [Thermoleophilia bacterium]|nr:hypothetical protein [Thermoleophilia bacterium]